LRVLLINSNTKVDFLAAPPIGLCYVADAAEEAGHEVRVLDLCFAGRGIRDLVRTTIQTFEPQVIGLSIRNVDNVNLLHPISYLSEVRTIVDHIREVTAVPLILGGSGASLMPEEVLRHLNADYIIAGEGEESLIRLFEALEAGRPCNGIPGVGFLEGNEFHFTAQTYAQFQKRRPAIGKWIPMAPYLKIGGSYNIQSRRGCRQRCIYCTYNQSLEGSKLRFRPPVEVVDEIEEVLLKYRPDTFEFVDSVFNDPKEHTIEILEEICRRPWKADFTAMGVSPRGLDRPFLDLMWRAGFRSFMITPESASATMIESYRKGFSLDEVVSAAECVAQTKFAAWWFFMIGGPGETNATLQESLDFAAKYLQKKSSQATNVAHFFTGVRVYPGTKLWEIAVRDGFIPNNPDPLELLWYVSDQLDLDRAVDQMIRAASACPEVYLGFDERILVFSRAAALFFNLFRFPKPYWQYFRSVNAFGLKSGLRFMFRPADIAQMVRATLERQRDRGLGVAADRLPAISGPSLGPSA
jgi:radical SAM superfamily enzyme YgiQ (UPF0313 family)